MRLQESGEMYLETIFRLTQTKNRVRAIDVCQEMGYSKPSVSRAMGLLKDGGFITVDSEGYLHLTDLGLESAQKTYERHTLLTTLFEKIGVPADIAAEDACRIEHCISDTTFEALKQYVESLS
ncbi:MAG: metal-dependent transcriptional regulator [Clostridia bacterium]|nr:metal-dependent transcriptional regulator [Clostridia bacterium]